MGGGRWEMEDGCGGILDENGIKHDRVRRYSIFCKPTILGSIIF